MQSSKFSGSYWWRAYTIRPVWLNILSEAAELAVVAKREQTSTLCNDVAWQKLDIFRDKTHTRPDPTVFKLQPTQADNVELAPDSGRGGLQDSNLHLYRQVIYIQ
jgi:hypothetical protein